MTGRFLAKAIVVFLAVIYGSGCPVLSCFGQGVPNLPELSVEKKLASKVAVFETRGRSLTHAVLDIAYRYQIPLGLEYADSEGVRRPLNLMLNDKSVREVLQALIDQLPQYRLEVCPGVIEIYSPGARQNPADPLNAVIGDFQVADASSKVASEQIYELLKAQHHQATGITNILDTGHPKTISLHLQNRRVYQLLNAIVAKNGETLWAVVPQAQKTSQPLAKPWEVYYLGPGWESLVLRDLDRVFAPAK